MIEKLSNETRQHGKNGCAGGHGGGKDGEGERQRGQRAVALTVMEKVVMVDVNARGERGQTTGLQHTRCTDL